MRYEEHGKKLAGIRRNGISERAEVEDGQEEEGGVGRRGDRTYENGEAEW